VTMRKPLRRALAGGGVALGLLAGAAVTAPAAEAQEIALEFDVTATIYIDGIGMENTVEGGTFVGTVDLATGELVADLDLPASETRLDLLGLPLADVGFATVPTGPTTGHIDLAEGTLSTTSEFDIHITHMRPVGLPFVNLVGDNCRTREPVSISTDGELDLADLEGGLEITAEFTIPKFSRCGLLTTPILNLLIPGDGNSFTAVLE
jgi:hypothetical protein